MRLKDLEEVETLRSKYEALKAKIEPFKDQLESYEAERDLLMNQVIHFFL